MTGITAAKPSVYFDPDLEHRLADQMRGGLSVSCTATAGRDKRVMRAEENEPLVQALIKRQLLSGEIRQHKHDCWEPLFEDYVRLGHTGFVTNKGDPSSPSIVAANRAAIRKVVRQFAVRVPARLGTVPEDPRFSSNNENRVGWVYGRRAAEFDPPRLDMNRDPLSPYEPELLQSVLRQNDALEALQNASDRQDANEHAAAAMLQFVYAEDDVVRGLMDILRAAAPHMPSYCISLRPNGMIKLLYLTEFGFATEPFGNLHGRITLTAGQSLEGFCRGVEDSLARGIAGGHCYIGLTPLKDAKQRELPYRIAKQDALPDVLPQVILSGTLVAQAKEGLGPVRETHDEQLNGEARFRVFLKAVEGTRLVKALSKALRQYRQDHREVLALDMGVDVLRLPDGTDGLRGKGRLVLTELGFALNDHGYASLPLRSGEFSIVGVGKVAGVDRKTVQKEI